MNGQYIFHLDNLIKQFSREFTELSAAFGMSRAISTIGIFEHKPEYVRGMKCSLLLDSDAINKLDPKVLALVCMRHVQALDNIVKAVEDGRFEEVSRMIAGRPLLMELVVEEVEEKPGGKHASKRPE